MEHLPDTLSKLVILLYHITPALTIPPVLFRRSQAFLIRILLALIGPNLG